MRGVRGTTTRPFDRRWSAPHSGYTLGTRDCRKKMSEASTSASMVDPAKQEALAAYRKVSVTLLPPHLASPEPDRERARTPGRPPVQKLKEHEDLDTNLKKSQSRPHSDHRRPRTAMTLMTRPPPRSSSLHTQSDCLYGTSRGTLTSRRMTSRHCSRSDRLSGRC